METSFLGLRTTIHQRLLDAGAAGYEPPRDVGGGIRLATVKDPWGNIVGIIDNPHFTLPAY